MNKFYLLIVLTHYSMNIFASQKVDLYQLDFKNYLLKREEYKNCPQQVSELCKDSKDTDFCPLGLSLSVKYAHLKGDDTQQAIIQGSSCNTGTAGPDIHMVYDIGPDGKPLELKIPAVDKKYYSVLFGNTKNDLSAKEGKLISIFTDTSGRQDPLVIQYEWKKSFFQVISVLASPSYKTSYDCTKAQKEQESAICYVKELADLDVHLDEIYNKILAKKNGSQKQKIIVDQKVWIVSRNKECPIYKWWVECLAKSYQDRINILSKMSDD